MLPLSLRYHLNWLETALQGKKRALGSILDRLRVAALGQSASPAMHYHFTSLLSEAVMLRDEENEIINRIEAVERRHHDMQDMHRLKLAPVAAYNVGLMPHAPDTNRTNWWWLLMLFGGSEMKTH